MPNTVGQEVQKELDSNVEDRLRRALMRLTSPQVEELQGELVGLSKQIKDLRNLEGDSSELQKKLNEVSQLLNEIENKSRQLSNELRDPDMIGQRLDTTIVPALNRQVSQHTDDVAETLAPVIGPAMRRQIRDARDDIVDALYPVIGQIINKAISEALRELTRNIDARLRNQLNFRDRISQSAARLRGVSEAEMYIRGSLPYSIERVFLVHRESGLLLAHISDDKNRAGEMTTISGMLTAIQDFVRDSFSGGEGDLEEITHGDRRILLEGGQRAYVAVVLSGVEPEGYSGLIRDVVHQINVKYEKELKQFDGNMGKFPDLGPDLVPLLTPTSSSTEAATGKPLTRSQKRIVGWSLAGLLLLIAAIIFSCIFAIRLWPTAFPARTVPPVASSTPIPSASPTATPSLTPTLVPTLTITATSVPTQTSTVAPSSPTTPPVGFLTGNLYIREGPSFDSASLGIILTGEQVVIWEHQDNWYHVSWPAIGTPSLEGWINGETFLVTP